MSSETAVAGRGDKPTLGKLVGRAELARNPLQEAGCLSFETLSVVMRKSPSVAAKKSPLLA